MAHSRSEGAAAGEARSSTGVAEEVARLEQALEDLSACEAASVSLVHCPSASLERKLVRELGSAARGQRCVTATVSLREHGLDSPDALVRQILDDLVPPGEARGRGLLWLLECFYDVHGADSGARFREAAALVGADGDLSALCAAYLGTDDPDAVPEVRAYSAWRDGSEPPRKYRNPAVRRALTERTAQRTLGELTRVIRALGYRGFVLHLTEGEVLAAGTERRREKGYTVMRELVDNFDGAGGAIATRVLLSGQDGLFEGARSVKSVAPLRMRLEIPSAAEPPPPHRSWTTLSRGNGVARHRRPATPDARDSALRSLVRISEGVPPTHGITKMSVGQERLDKTIARLFAVVKRAGSFFSVLMGEYGSGKTHLMMHLAERALEDKRPVFWLNLERTNLDLGNPARHLSRFLEHSQLPMRGRPNALALASRWTRSPAKTTGLIDNLRQIAEGEGEAAAAARKAVRIADAASDPGHALENFLTGADLENRPGDPSYRRDAYRRIFLWFDLLARQEEIRGPVILIDEAENLYTSGLPPVSRRTALRSLSFYCGGALPGTCVIMAMTPAAFEELKGEARDLLAEASELESTLELENVERFRRSLWGLKPDPVKALSKAERAELCDRVLRMHRKVRGKIELEDWSDRVDLAVGAHDSPRGLIRALVDELEAAWWKRP